MLVVTKNSLYEFDPNIFFFRKLKPDRSQWISFIGMKDEPRVGEVLVILQTEEIVLTTSTVVLIKEDEL